MKRYICTVLIFALALTLALAGCQKKSAPPPEEAPTASASEPESAPEEPKAEPQAVETPKPSVTASSVEGTAEFQHGKSGEKQPLKDGQELSEADIVFTGKDSGVTVRLDEGKEVHIGENTVFALSAIRRGADGNINILALKQGSIVNVVDTKLEQDDLYEVHTPRLVMSVRGTSNFMSSGSKGDEVIGITGASHVFSGGRSFNAVQGMAVDLPDNGEPRLKPSSSDGLPPLASRFAGGRNISYPALSEGDISNAQAGAGDYQPNTQPASDNFLQDLFNSPDITTIGEPPAAEPPPVQPAAATVPQQQEPQPQPQAQPPKQTPAPQPQAPAVTESTPTYSQRTSGSSSKSNSSSTNSNSTTTPTPTAITVTVRYINCATNSEVSTVELTLPAGVTSVSQSDLTLPANYYLNGKNLGIDNNHANSFPLNVSHSGQTLDIYVFEWKPQNPDEIKIPVYLYVDGKDYVYTGLSYGLDSMSFENGNYKLSKSTVTNDNRLIDFLYEKFNPDKAEITCSDGVSLPTGIIPAVYAVDYNFYIVFNCDSKVSGTIPVRFYNPVSNTFIGGNDVDHKIDVTILLNKVATYDAAEIELNEISSSWEVDRTKSIQILPAGGYPTGCAAGAGSNACVWVAVKPKPQS